MKKTLKTNFKSHLGLFGYNFFSNLKFEFWIWIMLQLIFETFFFFTFNYKTESNIYFKTRITWIIVGTILFINYIFFLVLNLINIFKSDIDNGMIVVFMSKPFSRLSLYLNKIVSLFTICFCYGFIFFIYATVLSFFMGSISQLMIVNISGYLLLTQLTTFFLIAGFILWTKISQKGLIIFSSLILFIIFPLTAVVAPGISGFSYGKDYSPIGGYNALTGKDLSLFEQSRYFLKKYGKDKIANELNEFFNYVGEYNYHWGEDINYENHHRKSIIEKDKNFTKTEWENIYINRLFTKWNKDNPVIISANSLENVYDNAVKQVNEIKNQTNKVNSESLLTELDFYLDLLKFAIVNEITIIDKMKSNKYFKNKFYTPLTFENQSNGSQLWVKSNDFTNIASNCFLTYGFRFYSKVIKPDFIKPDKNVQQNYNKYDINRKIKLKLVIPNYFNIFRQMLIMWQRPSLTRWRYEMNLGSDNNYVIYNFLNHHDFIPYYQKDDDKKINYFDVEKSGYQFNMPTLYICYVLVGIGFIFLSWLSYRKKDLV